MIELIDDFPDVGVDFRVRGLLNLSDAVDEFLCGDENVLFLGEQIFVLLNLITLQCGLFIQLVFVGLNETIFVQVKASVGNLLECQSSVHLVSYRACSRFDRGP